MSQKTKTLNLNWFHIISLILMIMQPVFLPYSITHVQAEMQSGELIIIDPGHGGGLYDGSEPLGAICVGFCSYPFEKDATLSIAISTTKFLREKGYQVILTRERDVYKSADSRWLDCEIQKPKLFVSIHANQSRGMEAFTSKISTQFTGNVQSPPKVQDPIDDAYKNRQSKSFAMLNDSNYIGQLILGEIASQTGLVMGTVKDEFERDAHTPIAVTRCSTAPSVLIEVANISDVGNSKATTSSFGVGIANGIDQYIKSKSISGPATYTYCIGEGGQCNFSGVSSIAYGANGKFNYKNGIASGISCNNSVFGDPIPGVRKACFVKNDVLSTPMPTTAPVPTCSQGQYQAEYFTGKLQNRITSRCEGSINYDWGSGSPLAGVPSDNFSARWTGTFNIGGNITFIARADDGVRVWVDDQLIIDKWIDQGATEYRATRSLSSGNHTIKMEYYENGGGAVAQLRWENAVPTPIPVPSGIVIAYRDPNFGSVWQSFGQGTFLANRGELNTVGNDQISSLKVTTGYQVRACQHELAGTCRVYAAGEYANLGDLDNQISSLEVSTASTPVPVPAPSQIVSFVNVNSGYAMEVAGQSFNNGTNIIQWNYNGTDFQRWRIESTGDGFNKLVNVRTGKCLNVNNNATDGSSLVQWDCNGGDNQRWRLDNMGNGQYVLVAKANSATRVVDVPGASKTPGQALIVWQRHNGNNQRWYLR